MYIVEGYPEFEQDVNFFWNDFIVKNNFEVVRINDNSIELRNEKCIIRLDLNADQRIYYYFQNPKSLRKTAYITLAIYFGINSFTNLLGGEKYPLTMDEWMNFYAEDDFRSICRVDLPIIYNEIKENFQFVIEGDFSWEKNLDTWQEWKDVNSKPGIPYQHRELSYKHFLEYKKNKK